MSEHTHGAMRATMDIMERHCPEIPQTEAMKEIIASTIDRETAAPDLLEACKNLANLAEIQGHCVGTWTEDHAALARQYGAEARDAITKAH